MTAAGRDDYRWLASGAAEDILAELANCPPTPGQLAATAARLRRTWSAAQTSLILETAALRQRAVERFPLAEKMLFTSVGLEQATDAYVARYKAQRFAGRERVVDLCTGVGGDLLALDAVAPVFGVERDPATAVVARANLRALGRRRAVGSSGLVIADAEAPPIDDFDGWHIDPDRRRTGRRSIRPDLHSPGPEAIARLLSLCHDGAVKLAPAAAVPPEWRQRGEREWISRAGECRQQVAWFGTLAREPGQRRAAVLARDGTLVSEIVGHGEERLETAAAVGRFVFEPDAAVLAAGLAGALAARHGLAAIAPAVGYLTGEQPCQVGSLTAFEIDDMLPFDVKRLRGALRARGIGRLEIKKRGVDIDPAQLAKRLAPSGDTAAVLLIAPVNGRALAMIARRV